MSDLPTEHGSTALIARLSLCVGAGRITALDPPGTREGCPLTCANWAAESWDGLPRPGHLSKSGGGGELTGQGTPDVPSGGPAPSGSPPTMRSPSVEALQWLSTRSGVRIRLPAKGTFPTVLEDLERALGEGSGVRGLAVTIDAAGRELGVPQLREIEVLLLERHGAALLQVVEGQSAAGKVGGLQNGARGARRVSRRTPVSSDPVLDGGVRNGRRALRRPWRDRTAPPPVEDDPVPRPASPAAGRAHSAAAGVSAGLPADAAPTLLLRRTLRSGQRVRFHGNVVVLGDVNPGAEIVAAGDIVVMGTLRGVAHAGATGSTDAIVAAFRLQPTQIRVGAVIGRAPDGQATRPDTPEMARLRDGVLVIERYMPPAVD